MNMSKTNQDTASTAGLLGFFGCCCTNCSKMMPIIALSVTETELYAAVQSIQDMIFIFKILLSLGLRVKLSMVLKVDNKGAVDFINRWLVLGQTRHIKTKQYFLHGLKEEGIIIVKWKSSDKMTSDIYTKNIPVGIFKKYGSKLHGSDRYYLQQQSKVQD